ncbi:hypothetical protein QZN11_19775 [Streptomyces gramineus]|uniref:hypothetical protein n=1 Tax=Streptomyces gramineus TaxID=910542 RepID=UPI00398A8B1A
MDETISGALRALELTSANAAQWLAALRRFEETQGVGTAQDWDSFARAFTDCTEREGLPSDVTRRFLEYAAWTHEAAGLVGLLAALPDDRIAAHLLETGWARLVTEQGAEWAGYDGSQAHWENFRDRFYAHAYTIDPQVYATAYEQLSPYDSATPVERYRALAGLGLPVDASAAAPTAFAEPAAAHVAGHRSFDEMSVAEVEEMILRCAAAY